MNINHADSLYQVASGQIENPSIELEIEGEKQKFEGRDARVFAIGILAGLKIGRDNVQANLETNFSDK
jgi:hypothetical protein